MLVGKDFLYESFLVFDVEGFVSDVEVEFIVLFLIFWLFFVVFVFLYLIGGGVDYWFLDIVVKFYVSFYVIWYWCGFFFIVFFLWVFGCF